MWSLEVLNTTLGSSFRNQDHGIVSTNIVSTKMTVLHVMSPAAAANGVLRCWHILHYSVCIYIYIHTHVCMYIYIYIYIHTWFETQIINNSCLSIRRKKTGSSRS